MDGLTLSRPEVKLPRVKEILKRIFLWDLLKGSPRFVQIGDAVVHTGAVCGAELL